METHLDAVEAALQQAEDDQSAIRAALGQLNPDRVASELKAALRSASVPDDHVLALRRRHETVHELTNQLDHIDRRIETTVADLETLAARTAQTMISTTATDVDAHLEQLDIDITALAAAHAELATLDPDLGSNRP